MKNLIDHNELKKHFPEVKNFSTWLWGLRKNLKLIPKSVRIGNLPSVRKGNIGVHPAEAVPYLKKILKLKNQGYFYKDIKRDIKKETEKIHELYKSLYLKDPRCKPSSVIDRCETVLKVVKKYYKWSSNSVYGNFFEQVINDNKKVKDEYLTILEKISKKDNDKMLREQRKQVGIKLDFLNDLAHTLLKQGERIEKTKKAQIGKKKKGKR